MDGNMPNIKNWVVVYPVYINSKKTIAQGRRINVSKACENPTCAEIGDCCTHFKLPFAIEVSCRNQQLKKKKEKKNFLLLSVDSLWFQYICYHNKPVQFDSCRQIKLIHAISCKEGECGCCSRKTMGLFLIPQYLPVSIISLNQFGIEALVMLEHDLFYKQISVTAQSSCVQFLYVCI